MQAGGINNSAKEGGIDIAAPPGTPVYALAAGPIVGSGYFCHGGPFNLSSNDTNCNSGYGVVTIRSSVPGYGEQDIYYQHVLIDPSIPICASGSGCTGYVQKGQQIGVVSSAGETEIGANANWGTIWGINHPAPWSTAPDVLIRAMINSDPSFNWGTQTLAGTTGAPQMITTPQAGTTFFEGMLQKAGLFLLALTLAFAGFYMLFQKQVDHAVGSGVQVAAKAAMA